MDSQNIAEHSRKNTRKLVEEVRTLRSRLAKLEQRQPASKVQQPQAGGADGAAQVIEAMSDAVATIGVDGVIRQVNSEFEKASGWSRDEAVGKTAVELGIMSEEEARRIEKEVMPRVINEGLIRDFKTVTIRRDGTTFPVLMSWSLMKEAEGEPTGIVTVARDVTDQKRAEQALEESEVKYRTLFEGASDAIILTKPDGENLRFVDCNKRALKTFGCERKEDFIGRTPLDFSPPVQPDGQPSEQAALEKIKLALTSECTPFSWQHTRLDGSPFDAEVSMSRLQIGGQSCIQGVVRDVTKRKRAKQALEESESRFRELVENIREVFWMENADCTELLYVSPAYEDIWGRSCKEFRDNPEVWLESIHPDDRQRVEEALSKGRNNGTYSEEFRIVRPDGSIRWIWDRCTVIHDEPGEMLRVVGIAEDITERRNTEDALRENEGKLNAMLESISDLIGMIDKEFNIIWANEATQRVFGDDIVGKKCHEVYHGRSKPCDRRRCVAMRAFNDGGAHEHETEVTYKDGRKRYHQCTANVALRDGKGKPVAVLEVSRDITERKRAEMALRNQREDLQIILDSVPAAIWYKDTENRILRVNRVAAESMGMKPEQLEGREIRELFPEDADCYYEDDLEVIRSGKPKWGIVEQLQVRRGDRRWVQTDKVPYWDEEGNIAGVIAFVVDITERKEAQERLLLLGLITEQVADTVIITDLDYRITYTNRAFQHLYGYRREELQGQTPEVLNAEPNFEQIQADIYRTVSSGDRWEGELENRRKDGSTFTCELAIFPLVDEKQNIFAYASVQRDITERKRAANALRDSEERYRQLVSTTSDAIMLFDGETRQFIDINKACEELYGYCREEFLGLKLDNVSAEPEKSRDSVRKSLRGEATRIPLRYHKKKDGTVFPVEISGSAFKLSGHPVVCGVIRDMTKRREVEKRAREHQAELARAWRINTVGEMASGLAHELNQPLCAIANYSNACLRMTGSAQDKPSEIVNALKQIIVQAERAGKIISHIRGLVAKAPPKRSTVQINKVVAEAIDIEETEATRKGITIETRLAEDVPLALADEIQIEQVVLNLLRNSIDALSGEDVNRRTVTIETARTSDNAVKVLVQDSGKGLPTENAEQVFDSFFTTKSSGLGMGLSLSRSIIEAHGGRLWAEPNPDGGAIFQFTLPVEGD
jgi:nitrogen fixation negative regulator NifL